MNKNAKYDCLSMEKHHHHQQLDLYEKEYMKMAMLKHEQTFKQQVCELHRLYQIQKLLMKNIDMINASSYEQNKIIAHHGPNLQRVKMQKTLDLEERDEDDDDEDDSKIELTLGLKSYKVKSDSGPNSFSSSSTGSSHTKNGTVVISNTSSRTRVEDTLQQQQQLHHPWILRRSGLYETS